MQEQEYPVAQPPAESVSCLRFSPSPRPGTHYLAASCWDGKLLIYQSTMSGNQLVTEGVAKHEFGNFPLLSVAWVSESSVVVGCGDGSVRLYDFAQRQERLLGTHTGSVARHVFFSPDLSSVASGSWDKTIRFWDLRANVQSSVVSLPERVYGMDLSGQWVVAATADRKLPVLDISKSIHTPAAALDTILKFQLGPVRIFSNRQGFVVGSVEGRCYVKYFSPDPTPNSGRDDFAFRCHRDERKDRYETTADVYPINDIAFHPNPQYSTFALAGGDRRYSFWDLVSRSRLLLSKSYDNTISSVAFSPDGSLFAFAASYDWHRGAEQGFLQKRNQICVKIPNPEDVAPKYPQGQK